MLKLIIKLGLLLSLSTLMISCTGNRDQEINNLNERLETVQAELEAVLKEEQEKQEQLNDLEEEESEEAAEDLAQLKAELEKLKLEKEEAEKKAATPPKPAPSKFGPGTMNHLKGNSDGYVSICTRSANGELSLRTSPDQGASKVTTIPNGTTDIYYWNRIKSGEYIWYESEYMKGDVYYSGWLRGDFLCS